MPSEEGILSVQGNRVDCALDAVRIQFHAPIVKERVQAALIDRKSNARKSAPDA